MADDFSPPDFRAPLAWQDLIASVPSDIKVRGIFFNTIADELQKIGHPEKPHIPFKHYPLGELMAFEVRAAQILYPQQPLREGLRRLGRLGYPSLLQTTPGRILFSVSELDFRIALTLASKAYGISVTRGTCEVVDMQRNRAHLKLTDIYNFVDCTQVGVIEGTMRSLHVDGSVLVRQISQGSIEFLVEWN
jgi:uncharacterized protein (TIGR02265 family)